MSKRWKWAGLGALLLATVSTLLLVLNLSPEPRFKGRTLSYWTVSYNHGVRPQESQQAVLNILSNHLPAVIELLKYDPMQSASNQVQIYTKAPDFLRSSSLAGYFFPFVPAARRSELALYSFQIAGPKAEFAIPRLNEAMLETNSDFACNRICYALAAIGPASRGAFEMMITNRTHPFRKNALDGLAHIPSGVYDSMEVLKFALEDPDPAVRAEATNVLGQVAGRKVFSPASENGK